VRHRALQLMPLGLLMLAFASCAEVNVDPLPSLYTTIPRGPRVAWSGIQSWMRQDNGCDFDHLERSRFDLMALAPRCVEGAALDHDDLARLKRSKWVLSYLDIARAAPAEPRAWPKLVNERSPFIAGPRTPWDSYPVDVTSDAWFRVLETIVRDDLARGYDGFWLDDCAGYWETRDANADAVRDHTNLVKRIRQLVNSIRPGVRLVCNADTYLVELDIGKTGTLGKNGNTPMPADQAGRTGFLEALDGVVVEGFTYHLPSPGQFNVDNNPTNRVRQERWFSAVRERGERVFTLDFAMDANRQRRAWSESRRFGFIPAVNRGNVIGAFMN
jgi:endo-alpha-1,4-polygalactosaminidase (GH114 family)